MRIRLLVLALTMIACSSDAGPSNRSTDPSLLAAGSALRFFHTDLLFPNATELTAARQGATVVLTFKAPAREILDGVHDASLRRSSERMAAAGGSWLVGYWHEPESHMRADTFRAAFRHVSHIVEAAGSVATVVVLMASTFETGDAAAWYPGDDAVDVVGVDGYDWRGCRTHGGDAAPGAASRSFGRIFAPAADFASAHGKPALAAEFGTPNDPGDPEAQARWLREADAWLAGHPGVVGAAYFDHGTSEGFRCNWRLDAEALAVYHTLGAPG